MVTGETFKISRFSFAFSQLTKHPLGQEEAKNGSLLFPGLNKLIDPDIKAHIAYIQLNTACFAKITCTSTKCSPQFKVFPIQIGSSTLRIIG